MRMSLIVILAYEASVMHRIVGTTGAMKIHTAILKNLPANLSFAEILDNPRAVMN